MAEPDSTEANPAADGVDVRDVELPPPVAGASAAGGQGQIEILLDSSLVVSATLGETKVLIRDLLQSGPGSVITFDRKVGEPVDLYLSGVHFATGQMVVVGDHLGVRITEVLSPPPADEGA